MRLATAPVRPAPSSTVGEAELVVAEVKDVTLVDALVVDAHALVVDSVGRPEVLDVVGAVATDDGGVFAMAERVANLEAESKAIDSWLTV